MGRGSTDALVRRVAPALAGGMLLLATAAVSQAAGPVLPKERLTLSATLGVGRPSGSIFREVYGSALTPFGAQLNWRPTSRGLEVFVGLRHVRKSGEAVVDDGAGLTTGERVSFRMTSVRLGVEQSVARGPWVLGAGIGASYNWYRERWPSFDLETTGARAGLVAQVTAARRLSRRWLLLARGEFSAISSAVAEDEMPRVGLGSLDLAAGVAFRF